VTDQLEDLFADLRTETMTQIRPPGTTAARQTVRRRRTTTSVAASAAVLAIAGGVGWLSLPDNSVKPVERPSSDPTELPAIALAAVHERISGTTVVESDGPLDGVVVDSADTVAGPYFLFVACAGLASGWIRVSVSGSPAGSESPFDLDGRMAAERTVPCGDPPEPVLISLTLPAEGALAIELTPSPEADGHAGYAYSLIAADRPPTGPGMTSAALLKSAARAIANTSPDDTAYRDAAGASTAFTSYLDRAKVPPGAYTLRAVCTGQGTLTVSAVNTTDAGPADPSGGSPLATWPIDCGNDPEVATRHLAFATGLIAIAVLPDAAARKGAAYGISLTRD
jgi:hypothetical protein